MKRKILLLAYGFVLITIWGICFLDNNMSDAYSSAMGLSFTFLSVYFLQKEYGFKLSSSDKLVVLALPTLFLIAVYALLFNSKYFVSPTFSFVNLYLNLFYLQLINPITIACIVLVLSLTKLRDLTKPQNVFVFGYITLFYAYFFQDVWIKGWLNR